MRYNGPMQTTIVLIRHGEVENPYGIFYGRLPRFGLSVHGRRQAAAAAQALTSCAAAPLAIFCSPMLRTRQTAQMIASRIPGEGRHVAKLLNEVYSPYDGCPMAELQSRDWEIYEGIPANYEQPADVLARILKFVAGARRSFPGGRVLAVTHGDLIYFMTLWAAGRLVTGKKEQTFYPAPASISSFVFDGNDSDKPEYSYYQPEII
ncbi:MAG: phosphoglycerate mutase family protein [Anaerolineaceae bacterium]|nr:phosphoglycerate mutase family protein [Anaerolineaceae bacterium]